MLLNFLLPKIFHNHVIHILYIIKDKLIIDWILVGGFCWFMVSTELCVSLNLLCLQVDTVFSGLVWFSKMEFETKWNECQTAIEPLLLLPEFMAETVFLMEIFCIIGLLSNIKLLISTWDSVEEAKKSRSVKQINRFPSWMSIQVPRKIALVHDRNLYTSVLINIYVYRKQSNVCLHIFNNFTFCYISDHCSHDMKNSFSFYVSF